MSYTPYKETKVKSIIKTSIFLLLTALFLAGCSNAPEQKDHDPYHTTDEQRSRADKAQGELSREVSK